MCICFYKPLTYEISIKYYSYLNKTLYSKYCINATGLRSYIVTVANPSLHVCQYNVYSVLYTISKTKLKRIKKISTQIIKCVDDACT